MMSSLCVQLMGEEEERVRCFPSTSRVYEAGKSVIPYTRIISSDPFSFCNRSRGTGSGARAGPGDLFGWNDDEINID